MYKIFQIPIIFRLRGYNKIQVDILFKIFFLSKGLLAKNRATMSYDRVAKSMMLLSICCSIVDAKITVTTDKTFHFLLTSSSYTVYGLFIWLIRLVVIRTCFFNRIMVVGTYNITKRRRHSFVSLQKKKQQFCFCWQSSLAFYGFIAMPGVAFQLQ